MSWSVNLRGQKGVFVFTCVHEICFPLQVHAQYVGMYVWLFLWWQTAEVLFLEELDNLSSENLSQPSPCHQQLGSSPSPVCDNDTIVINFI